MRVLRGIREVQRDAWDALAGASPSPFVRWDWLDALEASGSASPESGWTPAHLTLWRGADLIGAAPAWLKTHSMGEYIYDFGWAHASRQLRVPYYPKLVLAVPLSPATAPRFLVAEGEDVQAIRDRLARAAIALAREVEASSVHVLYPPGEDASALARLGFFLRGTLQYHWRNPGYASWTEFLSRFTSKRRNQLKRERAAPAEQGIEIRTARGAEIGPRHAELAWRFYEATNLKNPWGNLQLNQDFFARVVKAMPDAVEVVEARRAGEVIGGAFNLVHQTTLYGRYWGCFEEHPFLHFNVCLYHSIDECIRLGRRVFEPGAGGEHKISRGFEPTLVQSAHVVFHPKLARVLAEAAALERAELIDVATESEEVSGMRPWAPRRVGS